MEPHPIIFAGAGPGDPELITVKAQKAMAAADLVVYAGSLVPEAVLQWADPKAETVSSAGLDLEEITGIMVSAYQKGRRVVRLHTGDPSLYGAIFEQMVRLESRNVPYRLIPGVTAAFAAAAALGLEFTLPEKAQTLILTRMEGRTPVPASESLASLAAHRTSMAIYLSIGLVTEVADILSSAYGPDAPCVVAYRVSQPDEQLLAARAVDLAQRVADAGITRQALILVGPVLDARRDGRIRSKLYDSGFSHGFRHAK